MAGGNKKLGKAAETAEETEKVLYAPSGEAERAAQKHADNLRILKQVAEQKAKERMGEQAGMEKKDEAMQRFEALKKDIEALKEKRRAEELEKLKITREKEAREAEGRALGKTEEETRAYEQLAEELKKPEQPPKKKSWWESLWDVFRR